MSGPPLPFKYSSNVAEHHGLGCIDAKRRRYEYLAPSCLTVRIVRTLGLPEAATHVRSQAESIWRYSHQDVSEPAEDHTTRVTPSVPAAARDSRESG